MEESVYLTNEQARRFMLLKHGLLGDYRYSGKQGVLEYICQAASYACSMVILACRTSSGLLPQTSSIAVTSRMIMNDGSTTANVAMRAPTIPA